MDAVAGNKIIVVVIAFLILSFGSRNFHNTINGVTNVHTVDVHLYEVVVGVRGFSKLKFVLCSGGREFFAFLTIGDDRDGLVGALVQGDGLVS